MDKNFNIENELSEKLGVSNILQESDFYKISEEKYKFFFQVIEALDDEFFNSFGLNSEQVKNVYLDRFKEVYDDGKKYFILDLEKIDSSKIDSNKKLLDFISKKFICNNCNEIRNSQKINLENNNFVNEKKCVCGNIFYNISMEKNQDLEIIINKIDNFFEVNKVLSFSGKTPEINTKKFLKIGSNGIEIVSSSYDDFFDGKIDINDLKEKPEIYTIKIHYITQFGTDILKFSKNESGSSFVKDLQYFIRNEVYDISTNYETGEIFITIGIGKKDIPSKIPYNYIDTLGDQIIPIGLNKSTNRGLYFNFNNYDIVGSKKGDIYNIDNPVPHLFVVGGTGSGKSVWINNFLFQTMRQNSPENIGFLIIDPKRVSFNQYTDSPYLINPIVKEYEDMPKILESVVRLMDQRYKIFEESEKNLGKKVDDIRSYNKYFNNSMKYIFVIFDELAEGLDQQDRKGRSSIESSLKKIGQKARAAGIHLLLITQRASSENIGSEISANIGGRIALKTNSPMDSIFAIRDDRAFYINRPGMGVLYKNNNYSDFMTPFITDNDIKVILKTVKDKGYQQIFDKDLINFMAEKTEKIEEKKENNSSNITPIISSTTFNFTRNRK